MLADARRRVQTRRAAAPGWCRLVASGVIQRRPVSSGVVQCRPVSSGVVRWRPDGVVARPWGAAAQSGRPSDGGVGLLVDARLRRSVAPDSWPVPFPGVLSRKALASGRGRRPVDRRPSPGRGCAERTPRTTERRPVGRRSFPWCGRAEQSPLNDGADLFSGARPRVRSPPDGGSLFAGSRPRGSAAKCSRPGKAPGQCRRCVGRRPSPG